MALYLKLHSSRESGLDIIRFRSGLKFLDLLRNHVKFSNLKINLFLGQSYDDTYEQREYDFGPFESYFRKELVKAGDDLCNIGLVVEGNLRIKEKSFKFVYEVRPRALCAKEIFDIRLEILPNAFADVFEDLSRYNPKLRLIISERIRSYNELIKGSINSPKQEGILLKRAIFSKYDDENKDLSKWNFFYSSEESYFIHKIIDFSDALKDRLNYCNLIKFSDRILQNQDFGFLISKHSKKYNVHLEGGSIYIIPKDDQSMVQFVASMASDLNEVAKVLFKTTEETDQLINDTLSKLT